MFAVRETRISGLITVRMDETLDVHQLIRDMIELEDDQPYFMHVLKVRPIDRVLPADVDIVVDTLKSMNIKRRGSFRINVNKRHSPMRSMDLIVPIAKLYSNPVDLENPDWEIMIEIVADQLGIAIIEPDLVFSTDRAYQDNDDDVPNWFLD